ncbi:MAG: hypothetical protein K2H41_00165 [Acetatifactor sp.]|nr:hypothetical protein [Acetatifactor sp.]
MEKRTEVIQEWIGARKERGEITRCMFYITVPKDTDLYKDETIKKIEGILDKNHVSHGNVDTVCGAWNLNRDWIETGEIDCIVEFCGVYPVNWDMDDVAELERMETEGEIIVLVDWIEDGKHIPNH